MTDGKKATPEQATPEQATAESISPEEYARIKGKKKATKEYLEKKNNCDSKNKKIEELEKKKTDDVKEELEILQKEFKGLACRKYFDEHADKHREAHEKLAEDHAAALVNHNDRVHDAIKKEIDIGGILKIFSETIKKRSDIAMKKVLLKSDHLIDIVVATLEEKIKTSGVPAIMGIELVTGIISFIIDIIPIPEIGILATAVQGAGDVVINLISAVGPDSIIKTVEDSVLPIIEKIAVIFQGMAGSFSCCDKDKRQDKIKLSSSDKSELLESFKQLLSAVNKLNSGVEGEENKESKKGINDAITKLNAAIEFLEKQGNKRGGGLRRRTRRRRHHKTKRKLFQCHKSHKKKRNHKKRTKKH